MHSLLKEYFDNLFKSDRVGHAFLICNSNFDNLKDDFTDILSDYFFDTKINILENSDIYLIKPENGKILKDSILLLQEVFKTKSQLNKNRVYIIDGVETMNDYAANSLLKFLEEPEENIYAFLITANISKVLPTIKSRCQILMVDNNSFFDINTIDENIILTALSFVKCFEKYKFDSIAYIYEFIDKKPDKESVKKIIDVVMYFYRDTINYLLSFPLCYFTSYDDFICEVSKKNSVNDLVNKLIVLNKCDNMLEYNLNLNLFLDNLIIEMGML